MLGGRPTERGWVPPFARRSPLGAPHGAKGKEGAGYVSSASRVKRAVRGPPITEKNEGHKEIPSFLSGALTPP